MRCDRPRTFRLRMRECGACLLLIGVGACFAQTPELHAPTQTACAAPPIARASSTRVQQPASVIVNCTASQSGSAPALPLSLQSAASASSAPQGAASAIRSESNESWPTAWAKILTAVAWPIVALFALLFLGESNLRRWISRITKFKGGGVEIEFGSDAAVMVERSVGDTLEAYVTAADQAYARQARVAALREHLELAVRRALSGIDPQPSFRATVHVPDVIYSEYMYQLVDYYPGGGGARRRFSIRRGIVGRVWRLERTEGVGDVATYDPGPEGASGNIDEVLVREWSMTREEVSRWTNKRQVAFLCVLLRVPLGEGDGTGGRKVGILYIDSEIENAFGNDQVAQARAVSLERAEQVQALARAVDAAMQEMRKGRTDLKIHNG